MNILFNYALLLTVQQSILLYQFHLSFFLLLATIVLVCLVLAMYSNWVSFPNWLRVSFLHNSAQKKNSLKLTSMQIENKLLSINDRGVTDHHADPNLTHDLAFQSPASYGYDPYTCKKSRPKICRFKSGNREMNGWTRPISVLSPLMWSVKNAQNLAKAFVQGWSWPLWHLAQRPRSASAWTGPGQSVSSVREVTSWVVLVPPRDTPNAPRSQSHPLVYSRHQNTNNNVTITRSLESIIHLSW